MEKETCCICHGSGVTYKGHTKPETCSHCAGLGYFTRFSPTSKSGKQNQSKGGAQALFKPCLLLGFVIVFCWSFTRPALADMDLFGRGLCSLIFGVGIGFLIFLAFRLWILWVLIAALLLYAGYFNK